MTVQPEAPETEERSGLSRRTVIKGAAHAAWMVPAITVVTQAPALAASGAAQLSFMSASGTHSGTTITARVDVKNLNSQGTTAFQLSFQINTPAGAQAGVVSGGSPRGWGTGSVGTGSSKNVITFTATSQLLGNADTGTLTFKFSSTKGFPSSITVTALAGGTGTGANQTFTVPL
jgi:hypothetical protein